VGTGNLSSIDRPASRTPLAYTNHAYPPERKPREANDKQAGREATARAVHGINDWRLSGVQINQAVGGAVTITKSVSLKRPTKTSLLKKTETSANSYGKVSTKRARPPRGSNAPLLMLPRIQTSFLGIGSCSEHSLSPSGRKEKPAPRRLEIAAPFCFLNGRDGL
jgi:hypothetical protein